MKQVWVEGAFDIKGQRGAGIAGYGWREWPLMSEVQGGELAGYGEGCL